MSEEVIIARETENVSGTVQISGAKNSALKLIAATMLGQGKSTLHNIPHISDIEIMNDVIRSLGATVEWDGHSLIIDTEPVSYTHLRAISVRRAIYWGR